MPRASPAVRRQRCDKGRAAALREHLCRSESQLPVHDDVERGGGQMLQLLRRLAAAEDGVHLIARQMQKTQEFSRVVRPVAVARRHAEKVHAMRLLLLLLGQKRFDCRTCSLAPACGEAARKAAAVDGDDGRCNARRPRDGGYIVADQSCGAAADDGQKARRLSDIGLQGFQQIVLRAKDDGIVVELRAACASHGIAHAMLDVAQREVMAPHGAVDADGRVLPGGKKCHRSRERTAVRPSADIIETPFLLSHRSDLPGFRDDRRYEPYRAGASFPSTSRRMA